MMYFAEKKCTGSYCIVANDVNKQIGFHGNVPPSHKQCSLIKTVITVFSERSADFSF